MDWPVWSAIVTFVLAIGVGGRISVYRLENIHEREVRGQTGTPWLAAPQGLNIDAFNPRYYSPEGRRLLPSLYLAEHSWAVAILLLLYRQWAA